MSNLTADRRIRAAARVTITIELLVPDAWGNDCTIEQVQKQAKESAMGMLNRMKERQNAEYQIVGEPIVRAILVEEGR